MPWKKASLPDQEWGVRARRRGEPARTGSPMRQRPFKPRHVRRAGGSRTGVRRAVDHDGDARDADSATLARLARRREITACRALPSGPDRVGRPCIAHLAGTMTSSCRGQALRQRRTTPASSGVQHGGADPESRQRTVAAAASRRSGLDQRAAVGCRAPPSAAGRPRLRRPRLRLARASSANSRQAQPPGRAAWMAGLACGMLRRDQRHGSPRRWPPSRDRLPGSPGVLEQSRDVAMTGTLEAGLVLARSGFGLRPGDRR